jgi:hypothetical protein
LFRYIIVDIPHKGDNKDDDDDDDDNNNNNSIVSLQKTGILVTSHINREVLQCEA